jgi:4a-hydroxytetrahydrobiopterin dehydratase
VADSRRLDDAQVAAALAALPGWQREAEAILATYAMDSFPAAIELVRRAATAAEAAHHHPDIDVRYRRVTFRLTTHDAGGLTQRDVNLARRIQGHATALGWVVPMP